MQIIGISAKMGCGKTTFAKHLLDELGSKWMIISFGKTLKGECAKRFDFPVEWCYSEEGKNRVIVLPDASLLTVRALLQWWGTDVCRAKDPDYWVTATMFKINKAVDEYQLDGIIIDDVRFPNELAICNHTVRLEQYQAYKKLPGAEHISETGLDNVEKWTMRAFPMFGELPRFAEDFAGYIKSRGV